MQPDHSTLARKVEVEIVDQHFKNFQLLNFQSDYSIPFLLKIYGDFERHWWNLKNRQYSDFQITIFLFQTIHGISHCLKWVAANKEEKEEDIPGVEEWNEIVTSFYKWGMEYHIISQGYVAWSRGLLKVEVNEAIKEVKFIPPPDNDYFFVFQQQSVNLNYAEQIYTHEIYTELESNFIQWFNEIEVHPIPPPIANSVDWKRVAQTPVFKKIIERTEKLIFQELNELTDLGGYALKDFRYFYAILSANFHYITWIESLMDRTFGEENPYGSNPLDGPEDSIISFFSYVTDLSKEVVREIVNDMTLDTSNFHSSLHIQPVVKSRTNKLYVLPNLIAMLDPLRMLVGALNKGTKKKIYDRLINQIESFNLKSLAQIFSERDWQVLIERKLVKNGKTIHPDLIIIDNKNFEIIVGDYKHFIAPLSASEVHYKMKEVQKD